MESKFRQAFEKLLERRMTEFYSEMNMNTNKHQYTCLATPPELAEFGLTHMVCRVDSPERPVAAFNSNQAATLQCDSLNGFAKQDDPSLLGEDASDRQIREANSLAEQREKEAALAEKLKEATASRESAIKTTSLELAQKVALAQAAAKS